MAEWELFVKRDWDYVFTNVTPLHPALSGRNNAGTQFSVPRYRAHLIDLRSKPDGRGERALAIDWPSNTNGPKE